MAIKDRAYNSARELLVRAGSASAEKSHVKHTGGSDSPDRHGEELLKEAMEDFRAMAGGAGLDNGMSTEHSLAITKAARKMGLEVEYLD